MADHIIDAGPAINFLATRNQRILIAAIGKFQAPQAVKDEVMRKAADKKKPLLAPAQSQWDLIEKNWIDVLPATPSATRDRIARDLTRNPLQALPSLANDLGETYVVVHAVEQALNGDNTYVLIDDTGGQALTGRAQQYLNGQRGKNPNVGRLHLITTETILRGQATRTIKDRNMMRRVYGQLQTVNSGLAHISTTDLLDDRFW
jgi:hypothetical protein